MMNLARLPRPGVALALTLGLVLAAACNYDTPSEVNPGAGPEFTTAGVDCFSGCKDSFTDGDGTPLPAHAPDVGGFTWDLVEGFGFYDAEIRSNAMGVEGADTLDGQFVYLIPETFADDSAEIEVEIFGAPLPLQGHYSAWITLRGDGTIDPALGGYHVWMETIGGRTFVGVQRNGEQLPPDAPGTEVPHPGPGVHKLTAVLRGGTLKAYWDGVLLKSVSDPSPLPPGHPGFGLLTNIAGIGHESQVRVTSFAVWSGGPDSMTVNLDKDDVQVWPTGVIGATTTQVQLRVSVDSNGTKNVKDKWVMLSLAAVDSSGTGSDGQYGHFHTGLGGTDKPAGKLSKDSVNTGPSGLEGVVQFTGSEVSGPVVIRAEVPGARPDSVTIPVGVPNLVQLLPGPTFDTVGTKTIHPNSHWVTPAMRVRAEAFADSFFTRFHKKVAFNDASLPFGGKFDIHQQWASDDPECLHLGGQLNGCHAGHRRGLDVDLRTNNLLVNQIKAAKELWETVSGREIFPHPDHYHLPYRP